MRKIRFVRFRYSHHSPHSGYSRISEYGEKFLGAETIPVSKPLSRRIIRERMLWKLAEGTPGYTREAMAAELKVAQHILMERDCIYHFLYGETNYHYAGQLNGIRGNRILATFHQPPENLKKTVQIQWHLQQLSAILCVGTNQVDYFSSFLDRRKIYFVPLGVDIDYYQPPASFDQRDPDLCIVIGDNYRDFPTLRGVIELVSYIRPQTRFVCVMPPKNFPLIGTHPNLDLRTGIPEEELLTLYQSAALMVMPLYEATANNAVLESMACGLPMVVSDVGAVRDYVNPEGAELLPPYEARCMAETICKLLDDPQKRAEMANQARNGALKFTWPSVVEQLKEIYRSLD
jgi:glycosyltransferase involved in cell wall biosynthesis